jgi:hypothetical protein
MIMLYSIVYVLELFEGGTCKQARMMIEQYVHILGLWFKTLDKCEVSYLYQAQMKNF